MSRSEFHSPQRQSVTGVILIFAGALYRLIRSFWPLGGYLLVMDPEPRMLFLSAIGLVILLVGTLGYSMLYYLKFLFYIDEAKSNFILQKGVFNSDVVNIPFSKIQQVNFKRNILQRVIGVYSVVIDTAGSHYKEVEIKALSKEKADLLAEMLMRLSAEERGQEETFPEEEEVGDFESSSPVQWQYKLDIPTLLKLGLTSNYLRGVSLLLAFYFTVRYQFNYSEEFDVDISYSAFTEVLSTVLLVAGLLLVGMIITISETFIKYYNLELKKSRSGLQLEMGLRNNTRVNIKERRMQLLEEVTNPIQKRLDLYQLKISLASSENDLRKQQIKVPGLSEEIVSKVKDYFYGIEIKEKYRILPHKILLFRKITRILLPLLAGLALLVTFFVEISWWWAGVIGVMLIVLFSLFQYFYFKTIRLLISENFLVIQSGLWNRRKQFIEMYKLQAVSVSRPVWYRKRNLVDLTFHSAGGDLSFPLVNKKEVVPLLNYLMYRIESTSESWM